LPVSPIRLTRDGAIAQITLDRPDAGNAIDLALAQALAAAAEECASDASIRCVILSGAGRLFCAGGDVSAFAAAGSAAPAFLRTLADTLHRAIVSLARMPKPLVIAVNGPAAGAGLSLALLGDVVIAARSAHFTAAYTGIGLTPDGGMSWLLPRLVGLRRAQSMILTNERVTAAEAAAIGLVTRAVEDDELRLEVDLIANRLVTSPTAAIGAARCLLLDGAAAGFEKQLDREADSISRAGGRPEAREGVAAFLAKRKPDFEGAGS
jgi:2-(1,2-epoxy-1,2-dihydrophenyl)acetyl-CoA isomerase